MPDEFIASVLTAWALVVAIFDWRRRRVPNPALILVAVPAVLALMFYRKGLLGAGVIESLIGFAFGSVILFPGYLTKQVGAGDVKLAALLGLLLGIKSELAAILAAGIVIGLMAVIAKVRSRKDKNTGYRLPGAVALVAGFEWSLWYGIAMQ